MLYFDVALFEYLFVVLAQTTLLAPGYEEHHILSERLDSVLLQRDPTIGDSEHTDRQDASLTR